jgi:hypothetical protein
MAMSFKTPTSIAIAALVATLAAPARADTPTLKQPGDHPRYTFEAEPHLLLGVLNPPGPGQDFGFGAGFRGTLTLVRNGFIKSINNSIGIGFGFDWLYYNRGSYICTEPSANTPNGQLCLAHKYDTANYFDFPVVMQWNFWLTRHWSVFGEPGGEFRLVSPGKDRFDPLVFVGGRYQLSDTVSLTLRVGYPSFSAGASFFL